MSVRPTLTNSQQAHFDTALHRAVSQRRLTQTASLIEARANVNSTVGLLGLTPLEIANNQQWADGCALLLRHGANPQVIEDERDVTFLARTTLSQGRRPGNFPAPGDSATADSRSVSHLTIEMAISNKDLTGVGLLVGRGLRLSEEQKDSVFALLMNSMYDKKESPESIDFLLRHIGFSKSSMAQLIHQAIHYDWPAVIPSLLKAGADANGALHLALVSKKPHLLKYFLEAGADLEKGLELAVIGGEEELENTKCLISAGANKDRGLLYAIAYEKPTLVEYFISIGANKEQALIDAIRRDKSAFISQLIAAGIDYNRALQEAVRSDEFSAFCYCLDKGAIPSSELFKIALENEAGSQILRALFDRNLVPDAEVLQIAVENNCRDFLIRCVHSGVGNKEELLKIAVEKNKVDLVRDLLKMGASATAQVFKFALANNCTDILVRCLETGFVTKEELLRIAVEKNNLDLVRHIFRLGVIVSSENLFKLAVENSSSEIVHYFVDYGLIPTAEIWEIAFRINHKDVLDGLMRCKSIPNSEIRKKIILICVRQDYLALIPSLLQPTDDNTEVLKEICNIVKDKNKVLEFAILGNVLRCVEDCIIAGADVNRGLALAIKFGRTSLIGRFISSGADKDKGLIVAIDRGAKESALLLIAQGASVTMETLKYSLEAGNSEMALHFLTHGIAPNEEILQLAVEHQAQDVVRYLLDLGMVPTPAIMKLAVKNNDICFEMVRDLIEAGGIMDEETRNRLILALTKKNSINHHMFLHAKRPKLYEIEVYGEQGFVPLSSVDKSLLTKPLFMLNMAKYDAPGPYYGAITQYYTSSQFDPIYAKIARRFTLTRVLVDDKEKLVPTIDRIQAALPHLPFSHIAYNAHGGRGAIGLGKNHLTHGDLPIMKEIRKYLNGSSSLSLWGCLNAAGDQNLASIFSEQVFPIPVFASPETVSSVVPNTFQLTPTTPVFAPFFQDDYGKPEFMKVYRGGEEIADGYKLPSRL